MDSRRTRTSGQSLFNMLEQELIMQTIIELVGWALVHSLWQASIVGVLCWIVLRSLHQFAASSKCSMATLALVTIPMLAVCSASLHVPSPPQAETQPVAVVPNVEQSAGRIELEPVVVNSPTSTDATIAEPESAQAAESIVVPSKPRGLYIRPWLGSIVAIWAIGVAFLCTRLLTSWLSLRRLVAAAYPPADKAILTRFERLTERVQVRRPVVLLETTALVVPMVVGWIKPIVIVPTAMLSGMTTIQVEAILAHELAHILRHDYALNVAQNFIETIFFYHPAVWWISQQIREERENCCDDVATTICGSPTEYVRALTALEQLRSHASPIVVSAKGGTLLKRVRRILNVDAAPQRSGLLVPISMVATILVLGFVAGLQSVAGRPTASINFPVDLRDADRNELSQLLLDRWQRLDGPYNGGQPRKTSVDERVIANQRINRVRTTIGESIVSLKLSPQDVARLKQLRSWQNKRVLHPIAEAQNWLNNIATVTTDPIRRSFTGMPVTTESQLRLGKPVAVDDMNHLNFGPAGDNGLRMAWTPSPANDTYILGDLITCQLTLWNTGEQSITYGSEFYENGYSPVPAVDLRFATADGRSIKVKSARLHLPSTKMRWQIEPGQSAVIRGYTMKLGRGDSRELNSFWGDRWANAFMSHEAIGLVSGEEVTLTAHLPSPGPDGIGSSELNFSTLQSGGLKFKAISADQVPVWTATTAGTWPMATGARLKVKRSVFHGSDVRTTAELSWPTADKASTSKASIDVASDAFAVREPWAVVWERDQSLLWIGSLQYGRNRGTKNRPVVGDRLKRVDFSDPKRVVVATFSAWPSKNGPSAECRAAMHKHITFPNDGVIYSRRFHDTQPGYGSRSLAQRAIPIHLDKDKGMFYLPGSKPEPLTNLAGVLRTQAAIRLKEWQSWNKKESAVPLKHSRPYISLQHRSKLSKALHDQIAAACVKAGIGASTLPPD